VGFVLNFGPLWEAAAGTGEVHVMASADIFHEWLNVAATAAALLFASTLQLSSSVLKFHEPPLAVAVADAVISCSSPAGLFARTLVWPPGTRQYTSIHKRRIQHCSANSNIAEFIIRRIRLW
jgi:hypothetical protein